MLDGFHKPSQTTPRASLVLALVFIIRSISVWLAIVNPHYQEALFGLGKADIKLGHPAGSPLSARQCPRPPGPQEGSPQERAISADPGPTAGEIRKKTRAAMSLRC